MSLAKKLEVLKVGGRQKCLGCPDFFREDEIIKGYCRGCYARELRMAKSEVAKIETRAAARATTKLASALAKAKDTASFTPEILDSFYKEVGGPEGYGKKLAADFQKSRGVGLDEDELDSWEFNAGTLARWHDIILKIQQKEDERNTADISSISQEDLEATVKQVAIDLMLSDDDIRESVVRLVAKKNPELIQQIVRDAGMVALPQGGDDEIEYEGDEYE